MGWIDDTFSFGVRSLLYNCPSQDTWCFVQCKDQSEVELNGDTAQTLTFCLCVETVVVP